MDNVVTCVTLIAIGIVLALLVYVYASTIITHVGASALSTVTGLYSYVISATCKVGKTSTTIQVLAHVHGSYISEIALTNETSQIYALIKYTYIGKDIEIVRAEAPATKGQYNLIVIFSDGHAQELPINCG